MALNALQARNLRLLSASGAGKFKMLIKIGCQSQPERLQKPEQRSEFK